jgi:hypothetical protein
MIEELLSCLDAELGALPTELLQINLSNDVKDSKILSIGIDHYAASKQPKVSISAEDPIIMKDALVVTLLLKSFALPDFSSDLSHKIMESPRYSKSRSIVYTQLVKRVLREEVISEMKQIAETSEQSSEHNSLLANLVSFIANTIEKLHDNLQSIKIRNILPIFGWNKEIEDVKDLEEWEKEQDQRTLKEELFGWTSIALRYKSQVAVFERACKKIADTVLRLFIDCEMYPNLGEFIEKLFLNKGLIYQVIEKDKGVNEEKDEIGAFIDQELANPQGNTVDQMEKIRNKIESMLTENKTSIDQLSVLKQFKDATSLSESLAEIVINLRNCIIWMRESCNGAITEDKAKNRTIWSDLAEIYPNDEQGVPIMQNQDQEATESEVNNKLKKCFSTIKSLVNFSQELIKSELHEKYKQGNFDASVMQKNEKDWTYADIIEDKSLANSWLEHILNIHNNFVKKLCSEMNTEEKKISLFSLEKGYMLKVKESDLSVLEAYDGIEGSNERIIGGVKYILRAKAQQAYQVDCEKSWRPQCIYSEDKQHSLEAQVANLKSKEKAVNSTTLTPANIESLSKKDYTGLLEIESKLFDYVQKYPQQKLMLNLDDGSPEGVEFSLGDVLRIHRTVMLCKVISLFKGYATKVKKASTELIGEQELELLRSDEGKELLRCFTENKTHENLMELNDGHKNQAGNNIFAKKLEAFEGMSCLAKMKPGFAAKMKDISLGLYVRICLQTFRDEMRTDCK